MGIGTTNPLSKLSVNTDGNSSYTFMSYTTGTKRAAQFELEDPSNSSWNIVLGTYIRTQSTGSKNVGGNFYSYQGTTHSKRMFGVRAVAGNGYDGYNFGVLGVLSGSRDGAGIVGLVGTEEPDIDGKYAGYFDGDVKMLDDLYVGGEYNPSDINLKKDIRLLSNDEITCLEKLQNLSAIRYKLKTPAELNEFDQAVLDTIKVDPRTLEYNQEKYTRDRIGLSAQDVQLVFPELVKEDSKGYLSVNYVSLIPVLINALNEQEVEIEALRKEIAEMKVFGIQK